MMRDDAHSDDHRPVATSRRRRRRGRRRPRPLRRRRVRLIRRRGPPRRLIRVPGRTKRVRLSRDNIQLHPIISRRTSLITASSPVPRLVSYSPTAAQYLSDAVQYAAVPAGYSVDAASQSRPVIIQPWKPLSSSSAAAAVDNRRGLEDLQLIGIADRKATTSLGYQQEGNYVTMTDGEVSFPVTLRQVGQDVVVPLTNGDQQRSGDGVQLVMPVKNSMDQSSAVQLVTADNNNDPALVPFQTVREQFATNSPSSESLRTSPEVRTSSPTYIILKLSGTEEAGETRRRGIPARHSVDLGETVKYIDLSALLSKSVTPSPTVSTERTPPRSRHRSKRPRAATKPSLRRPPRPPSSGQIPSTTRHRPRERAPPPPRPIPPPASHQEPYNYRQQHLEPSGHSRRRYQPSRPHPHHHFQHQQHHHQQQQREYNTPNEHQQPSHPPYQHSWAVRPTSAV